MAGKAPSHRGISGIGRFGTTGLTSRSAANELRQRCAVAAEFKRGDPVTAASAFANRLLKALPRREYDRLAAQLEGVDCPYKEVLVEADGNLGHVYFPNSGVISVVGLYSDGTIIEMATIGREGCTGFQELLGSETSAARFLVQIPGTAARMKRSAYDRAVKELPVFRTLMTAHLHAFLQQVMLSAACNGTHTATQRLSRWLLMMRDRQDSEDLPITQDLLAEMLALHRPTITKVARRLQKRGIIQLKRKLVRVLDRDGLMHASCECYQLTRARTAQYLPKTYPD